MFSIFDNMDFLFEKVTERMIEKFNSELIPYEIDSKEFGLLAVMTSMTNATQQQIGLQDLTQAPCFIIIAERKGMPPVEKPSLAHTMQNMWLKATVLGLGFRLISMTENLSESDDFLKLLAVPYGEFAFNGCIIGYQVNEPTKRNRMYLENVITWL